MVNFNLTISTGYYGAANTLTLKTNSCLSQSLPCCVITKTVGQFVNNQSQKTVDPACLGCGAKLWANTSRHMAKLAAINTTILRLALTTNNPQQAAQLVSQKFPFVNITIN